MATTLKYGDVENILAQAFNVEDAERKAFRARLRHLRNHGVPDVPKVGKGTQAEFTIYDLVETALAAELSEVGMAPAAITGWVRRQRGWLRKYLAEPMKGTGDDTISLAVTTRGFGPLGRPGAMMFPRERLLEEMHSKSCAWIVIPWGARLQRIQSALSSYQT